MDMEVGLTSPSQREQETPSLPSMRQDVSILKGMPFWTGAPSYLLHDPARNKYFTPSTALWKSGIDGVLFIFELPPWHMKRIKEDYPVTALDKPEASHRWISH